MPRESTKTEGVRGRGFLLATVRRLRSNATAWTWLFVGAGVIFRVLEYSDGRRLYEDEASLFRNLEVRPVFDFSTPLAEYQLAPPGFLVVETVMVRLPFSPVGSARLIPLLCGIASIFLMRSVAGRYISPRAVPIAVGLFAFNDWLIYYSTEIKQYSSDTMLTLIALLLATDPALMSRRRLLGLAAFGAVGVWFSHPLAMVLGAVGTYLAGKAAFRHDWKRAVGFMGISLLWAVSFVICYMVSHRILSREPFIWDWWHFAFLPIPPRSLAEFERVFWQVLNIFNNPAWVLTPLGVLASAFIAMGLYMIGALSLGRKWRGGAYLLVAPLLITLVASSLHQYPFHGRLLLFLVPAVHLLVGEGAVVVARRGGVVLTVALGAFLIFQPAEEVLWNRFVIKRIHGEYDSHGDLLPDLLDYLDQFGRQQARGPRAGP